VAKYSQNGVLSWSKSFPGEFWAFRLGISVHNDNLYIGGNFLNADFDDGNGTVNSTDAEDIFIMKMDTTGAVLDVQTFPGIERDELMGFTSDSEGNVYFSGRFRKTLVLPNGTTLGSADSGWTWAGLIKLNSNLDVVWSKTSNVLIENQGRAARGFELISDDMDNIYMGGFFSYELSFGDSPVVTNTVARSPFVAKFDKDGTNQWIYGTSTANDDFGTLYAMALDDNYNIYYGGQFAVGINVGGVDYNSKGASDAYVGKLNSDGAPSWFNVMGTEDTGLEWTGVVDLDSNGDLFVVADASTANNGLVIMDSQNNAIDFGTDKNFTTYIAKYDTATGLLKDAHGALYQDGVAGRGGIIVGDNIFRSGNSALLVGELLSGLNVNSFVLPRFSVDGVQGNPVTLIAEAPNAQSYQWYVDNTPIGGATNSSYDVVDPGFYSLEITNSFACTLTSRFDYEAIIYDAASDSLALVALYNSTGGANWTNTWDLNQPMSTWYGVTLTDGRVTSLDLGENSSQNLVGSLPSELGNLNKLETLHLWNNQLTGNIPAELGKLNNLISLQMSRNQLSGNIPTEVGDLKNLVYLYLTDNELSGNVPPQIGNMENLEYLQLGNNQLSGTIPIELANITGLKNLFLSSNQLSGTIPVELANLANIERIYLHNNQLTGSIPNEFGSLTNLTELHLHTNNLSGTVPEEIGALSSLNWLLLQNNPNLYGSIPNAFISLPLITFNFSSTGLCEPSDANFQTWKATIPNYTGTGISCQGESVNIHIH
jgi:Leucine-rich repeat (LRR) protein